MSLQLGLSVQAAGIKARTKRAKERLQDPRTFEVAHPILLDAESDQFDSEGAAGPGGRWAPLRWRDTPPPILDLTGRLKASLTGDGAESVWRVDAGPEPTIVFGSAVPYARYHQSGTAVHVARPPIDLTQASLDAITQAVLDRVTE